jgi:hypothetical protein
MIPESCRYRYHFLLNPITDGIINITTNLLHVNVYIIVIISMSLMTILVTYECVLEHVCGFFFACF